jgi:hypothetical protein
MAVQPSNVLKSYFETGDKPTQGQFGDLIDTMFNSGTTDPLTGNAYKALLVDGSETGTFWGGLTDLLRDTSNRQVVYLAEEADFRNAVGTNVATIVQGIINSFSAGTAIDLVYPVGTIYQGDVTTNGRSVNFIAPGTEFTTIIPTSVLVKAPFALNDAYSSIQGMTINDIAATWDLPGYIINNDPLTNTKSMVLLGDGGNSGAIKLLVDDVDIRNSRGQGIRYSGGPISVFNRVGITGSSAGGMYGTNQGGDTNHWKMQDVTFTRNFGFGMWLVDSNNGGGAGSFTDTKFYQNEAFNLRIDGNANSGSVFVELSNGWSGNGTATRTIGSPDLQVIRNSTTSLTVGMYLDNPVPFGFPLGTYIAAVNKNTGVVTLSQNATSSGSSSAYAFYSQRGMRNPSVWFGPASSGNQIHVVGDALDPECYFDESPAGANRITVTFGGTTFGLDDSALKMRVRNSERNIGDPNRAMYFTTYATFTSGLPTITLSDTSVMNRIKYGATLSSSGALASSTTVSSVDTATGVVTMGANAIASGVYQVIFRPDQSGGYLWRMLGNNISSIGVTGTNISQKLFWTSRSGKYIGNVTAGSPIMTSCVKYDNESQTLGTGGGPMLFLDNTIVPNGTTIVSRVTEPDGTFTVTMSQNALLTRTAVEFLATNTVGIRQIWQNTLANDNNADAIDAGRHYDEIYRTDTGALRMVVPEAGDGTYRVVWDPTSIAAGGIQSLANFTVDADSKALTNMAIGDDVVVNASRDLQGMRVWGQITAANTMMLYMKNETAGAIDLGSTNFYITHTPR